MRTVIYLSAIGMAALTLSAAHAEPFLSIGISEDYGEHVVGPDGRPVYAFETELRGGDGLAPLESCLDPCRERWPPVFSGTDIAVGEGLDPELAGTIEDQAGRVAVYAGEPLFYFFEDQPGQEPVGQAIHSFGGWWYLMRPDGKFIDTGITPETDG